MSSTILFAINQRLWLLKKPLGEAREKVRRLEEDERTLTWMQKVDESRMRRVERMVSDLEPPGRVRRMLMRLIGVKRPDMVRDIAGFLLEPVTDELEELRKRLADSRKEFCRLEDEEHELTSRKSKITRALRQSDEETVRRFEAPGRVRTALVRMVDDVFATMKRQDEASVAGDFEEVWRLLEVEKAQRAQLHGLWRLDPVRRTPGAWTAVTKEKRVEGGRGEAFPAMRAKWATGDRLKEARVDGCPEEIRRLEEEERLLDERVEDIGGCLVPAPFCPAGFLAPPRGGASRQKRVAA